MKQGGVTVKVNTVSLVKVPHICTKECEVKENDSTIKNNKTIVENNNENSNNGVEKNCENRKGHEIVQDETDGNLPSCSKTENDGKRKQMREDKDNRKKQRNYEDRLIRSWKSGDRFQGIDAVTGEYVSGKILSKVRGDNENLYNIQSDQNGYQGWFDMTEVKDISVVNDAIEMVVFYNNSNVAEAKEKEINSWISNEVFEIVENKCQKYISMRWVITEKMKEGKVVTKARLVARGFEENTTNLQKDSPTCSREAIRILITIASAMKWNCHTIDIKSAYLQGNNIQRQIFLKPPKEYDEGKLWKLKKTVYGLCDAARAWYLRVKF